MATTATPPISRTEHSSAATRKPTAALLRITYCLVFLAAILLNIYNDKRFLGDIQTDGFTFQVNYISNYFSGGGKLFDLEPLLWIHSLRTVITEFFLYFEELGGPGLATFVILLLYVPVIRMFRHAKWPNVAVILPLTVVLLSYRSSLVILSLAYLMMFVIDRRSWPFLVVSFLFANLSSGAVLNSVIIALTIGRTYRRNSVALYVYIGLLLVSFYISATDKYSGFSQGLSGYDATVYGVDGVTAILSRNTIFVSLLNGDYERAIVYSLIVMVALVTLVVSLRDPKYRGYGVIFLSAVPSFLLEGLGVVSLIVPFLLFLANLKLPLRPDPSVAAKA
ncbi:MAG: hypothetical protein V4659_10985 [Pseudomonadota bacterium]